MPRTARLKYVNKDCYYHLYNHVACKHSTFPLDDICKNKIITEMRRLSIYYTIEIIAFTIMSNHFHIVAFSSKELPTDLEVCNRHNTFYRDRRPFLDITDKERITHHARRMRDISEFMKDLQREFTVWYNKVIEPGRMGAFWASRFKSTILQRTEKQRNMGMTDSALLRCIEYVELNPVRAGIVDDPADYRFSSWGIMEQSGIHPFANNFVKHVSKVLRVCGHISLDLPELENELRGDMARIWAYEQGYDSEHIHEIMNKAKKTPTLMLKLTRHCRYWTNGLIIGSKTFIKETTAELINEATAEHKHFAHIHISNRPCDLHSFRLSK